MTESRLRAEFDRIRTEFFPRWHGGRLWRARIVKDLNGAMGYCDTKSKTIKAIGIPDDDDELAAFLIHEIAHAVAPGNHSKLWLTRMEKAVQRAEAIGRSELGSRIRDEIKLYEGGVRETAAAMYAHIEDAVHESPSATYWQVVDYIRREYAALSRRDFLRKYPRTRKVCDRACMEKERTRERRAAWLRTRTGE